MLAASRVAVAGAATGIIGLGAAIGPNRTLLLFGVGTALGVALHQAAFGFAGAYRAFITERRSAGIRAQLLLLSIGCLMSYPALQAGMVLGQPVNGFVVPVGVAVLVGAFLFGIGMQLAGGCGSGTLFTLGGGSTRMIIVLAAFILGSVVGIAHLPWWYARPAVPALLMVDQLGAAGAVATSLTLLATAWIVVRRSEQRRHGHAAPLPRALAGSAVAIALLGFATLILAGRPWGITQAFGLWGGKAMQATGIDISAWAGWDAAGLRDALAAPVLHDVTSVMDLGIMLGALLSAGISGRFSPAWRIPVRQVASSMIGGVLMGYGARLASGCNIGAFVGGVVSGSLHGWVWIVCALLGTWIGIRLRPWFGWDVTAGTPTGHRLRLDARIPRFIP